MALIDLLQQSRSYRSFHPSVRLKHEELLAFINCARFCPSSMNTQMLKFRPVTEESELKGVFKTLRWAAKIQGRQIPPLGHEPSAYIVICADKNVISNAESFQKDVGICAQAIMLAVAEAGYGGCMLASFQPAVLTEALHLPDGLIPMLVLALGKPDETIVLTDAAEDGSVTYYREGDIHFVQKRDLKDLIIK